MDKEIGRGDGKIPIISIEAENLAEATRESIITCYKKGARVETPKHHEGGTLGYDADMTIRVAHPETEPSIYAGGMFEDGRGIVQYMLEVTHGIHNHWKKSPEHPERWGYTYNERFVDQLPFVFQRIKDDWNKKGRITGRDYQFTIWRPGEDIILEQEDPPCFQRGNLRFVQNEEGEIVMNYITDWRSRDLAKAWNENNLGQIRLQKLFTDKVSDMLDVPIQMGAYIDRSSSLHLYGFYFDRDNFGKQIERMINTPYEKMSYSLEDYLQRTEGKTETELKRLIAAQMDAESK
jgi:thymidylate synthase